MRETITRIDNTLPEFLRTSSPRGIITFISLARAPCAKLGPSTHGGFGSHSCHRHLHYLCDSQVVEEWQSPMLSWHWGLVLNPPHSGCSLGSFWPAFHRLHQRLCVSGLGLLLLLLSTNRLSWGHTLAFFSMTTCIIISLSAPKSEIKSDIAAPSEKNNRGYRQKVGQSSISQPAP